MFKRLFSFALVSVLMVGLLAACGSKDATKDTNNPAAGDKTAPATEVSGTVTASGSTALLPLVKAAAEDFMAKNSKATINPTGGGSGTGLKNVADGTSDIGNSDVAAGDEYKDKGLVDHIVAVAPFGLIVNKDVTVDNLTKQQAADIYLGKITNWKQLGGADKAITVVHRPDSSGSKKLIKQIVLDNKDFAKTANEVTQESSNALKTAVSSTSGAIGYIDTPYVDDTVKLLKWEGTTYKPEEIKAGKWPLYGIEHMYTKGEPKGATKAFLDFIMSDAVQNKQVVDLKFLPANYLKK